MKNNKKKASAKFGGTSVVFSAFYADFVYVLKQWVSPKIPF